jgi:hypothetical protein
MLQAATEALTIAELEAIYGKWMKVSRGEDIHRLLADAMFMRTVVDECGRSVFQAFQKLEQTEKESEQNQAFARADIAALNSKVAQLQASIKRLTSGLKCFACGVDWSEKESGEPCDMAHREHWPHEWVNQRTLALTAKHFEQAQEIKRLQEVALGLAKELRTRDFQVLHELPVCERSYTERVEKITKKGKEDADGRRVDRLRDGVESGAPGDQQNSGHRSAE